MWEIRKKFKDYEQRKIYSGVLDESTLFTLYKLSNKGYFDILHGFLKQGKESSVLLGEKEGEFVAIKIHALEAGNFKKIWPYLEGDRRFFNIKRTKRGIIYTWCKKEYKNMIIAYEKAKINAPRPIAQLNNVLIMEFLGENFTPAPRLTDVHLENPEDIFKTIIYFIKKLYKNNLIHADLSFYNILYFEEKPYFIDFSQGVLTSHPNAEYLLKRDIKNICQDFKRYEIDCDEEKIYEEVIS